VLQRWQDIDFLKFTNVEGIPIVPLRVAITPPSGVSRCGDSSCPALHGAIDNSVFVRDSSKEDHPELERISCSPDFVL
jgi:hypothetical protein